MRLVRWFRVIVRKVLGKGSKFRNKGEVSGSFWIEIFDNEIGV